MKVMKKLTTVMAILGLASICTGLVSCEKDVKSGERQAIGFNVRCARTKSAPINTTSLQETYGKFWSVAFLPGETEPFYTSPVVESTYGYSTIDNETRCWVTGEFWPEDAGQAVDFWSFAPTSEFKSEISDDGVKFNADHSVMTFKYAPVRNASRRMDATDQKDIIVAYTGNRKYGDSSDHRVPVTFNHAMSAIRFKVGNIASEYSGKNIAITSMSLEGFASNGTCIVTKTADIEDSSTATGTIKGSNTAISWTPGSEKCTYQQFFLKENISTGQYLDGGDKDSYGEGMFMIVPQTTNGASFTLNWGLYENPDGTTGGEPEFLQRTSRSSALKNIKFEPGYIYTFTINIKSKTNPEDPSDPEKDIYVELTEEIRWDHIVETKEYDEIQTGYPKIEFHNVNSVDETNHNVYVYQYPQSMECWVKLSSPKGAKLLVTVEREFDAFECEFITSDQIPEDSNQPIKFKLTPVYEEPEREYVASISLSLRLINGRVVNIDNQVQQGGKYNIILRKAQ